MANKQEKRGRHDAAVDDIRRGNVGTGDQGPGDVSPDEHVGQGTGEIEPGKMGQARPRTGSRRKDGGR